MKTEEGKSIQAALSMALAGLAAYLGMVAVPVTVLLVVMIVDYITGMIAAWHGAELSSKKGIFGIVKKISYFGLVCVGMGVDWLIYSGLESIHVHLGYSFFFGVLVTIWLIINELISILENLGTIGVPVPNFLLKVIKRLKIAAEKTAETAEKESEKKKDEKGN